MAIIFAKTQKRQRLMVIVLIVIVLATTVILFAEKFKKLIIIDPILSVNSEVQGNQRVVKIDFQIFDLSIFDELEAFSPIPVFEGVSERDNPFSVQKAPLLK